MGEKNRAQSEVIGVILLTAVIVVLTVLVGVTLLGTVDTQDEPVANLQASVDATNLTITHHGGSTLQKGEVSVILGDGSTQRLALEDFKDGVDDAFGPGNALTRRHGALDTLAVLVVHDPTNTILLEKVFDVPETVPVLSWESAADWDDATAETRVVHESVGDRRADRVELGYPSDASSLVGHWPLDGGSGDAIDVSGTGNDGSVDGSPTREVVGLLGTTTWSFDGVDDQITVPDDPSLEMNDTDAVTVSMWVKKDSEQSGWIALLQHSDASYNLQFDGGNQPAFTIFDDDWHTAYGDPLEIGEWYHLVGTYDGSDVRLYVNGAEEGTDSAAYISSGGGNPVGIAYNTVEPGRHLDGRMDAIQVYDRALSQSEVAELWNTASNGTLTTANKTFREAVDPNDLTLSDVQASLPGGTNLTVYVESDPHGNGSYRQSDEIRLDGSDSYEVTGLSEESRQYRLRIAFQTGTVVETPTFSGATLRAE